jgi:hypothetical protein
LRLLLVLNLVFLLFSRNENEDDDEDEFWHGARGSVGLSPAALKDRM